MAKRTKTKRRGKTVLHWIAGLIAAGVICVGIALGLLCWAETHPPKESGVSQAMIVLGAQVYPSGAVSPQLELRLQAALDSYRQNPRLIVVCGAQGDNEPAPEGDVMRQWLIDHGVPEAQVVSETQSYNTRQNLQNAAQLLPQDVTNVTVVTSDYHLPRALAIARDLGLSADGIGSPCRPEIGHWLKNHSRELLAWGKYWMEKLLTGGA